MTTEITGLDEENGGFKYGEDKEKDEQELAEVNLSHILSGKKKQKKIMQDIKKKVDGEDW